MLKRVTIPAITPRRILSHTRLANRPITFLEEVRKISEKTVKGSWMLRAIWLQISQL
jgi:hypothetical protein